MSRKSTPKTAVPLDASRSLRTSLEGLEKLCRELPLLVASRYRVLLQQRRQRRRPFLQVQSLLPRLAGQHQRQDEAAARRRGAARRAGQHHLARHPAGRLPDR